jgi:hypothetical protein
MPLRRLVCIVDFEKGRALLGIIEICGDRRILLMIGQNDRVRFLSVSGTDSQAKACQEAADRD